MVNYEAAGADHVINCERLTWFKESSNLYYCFLFLFFLFSGATCGTIHVLALLNGAPMRLSVLRVLLVSGMTDAQIISYYKEMKSKK